MTPEALARVVSIAVPGARLRRAWPLTGGVAADVRALEIELADGSVEQRVLRRRRPIEWKIGPIDIGTEFALLEALRAAELPVPAPQWLDAEGAVLESPGFVMAFVEGTTVADVFENRPLTNEVLDQLAAFLASVHQLDVAELPPLPSRVDPVPELLDWLDEGPVRQALSSAKSDPRAPKHLLHGDYWAGNVLWRDDAIAAVLDWEDAALGDPLSDLAAARQELLWRYGASPMNHFTEHYLRLCPIDTTRLPLWDLYVGTAAMDSVANWGLDAKTEAQMRSRMGEVLAAAEHALLNPAGEGRSGS